MPNELLGFNDYNEIKEAFLMQVAQTCQKRMKERNKVRDKERNQGLSDSVLEKCGMSTEKVCNFLKETVDLRIDQIEVSRPSVEERSKALLFFVYELLREESKRPEKVILRGKLKKRFLKLLTEEPRKTCEEGSSNFSLS